MDNTKIAIPASPSDITAEWIRLITGDNCLQESINVIGNIQEGYGFLSSMFRVSYKTENEKHSIIVKLLPKDQQLLEFTLVDFADQREIQFYSVIVPDILEVLPCLEENLCKFYHGQVKQANVELGVSRESMLVLEDLKLKGFDMMPFSGDPSEERICDLVKCVAKMHFAANAVSVKKNKSIPELYPFLQGIEPNLRWQKELETMGNDGLPGFKKRLLEQNLESVWLKYENVNGNFGRIIEIVEEHGRNNASLIHTDIWPPNTMVHDKLPVKIIDWQLSGYRDATYELSFMLTTVIPAEKLSKKKLTEYLRIYWNEYERLCETNQDFGGKVPRRDWKEFEYTFFTWGCAWAYMWMVPGFSFGFEKDHKKYVNVFRVMCEEIEIVEFLMDVCNNAIHDEIKC